MQMAKRLDEKVLKDLMDETGVDVYAQERMLEANTVPDPKPSRGHGASHDVSVRASGL